jgi:hypothetical protein
VIFTPIYVPPIKAERQDLWGYVTACAAATFP